MNETATVSKRNKSKTKSTHETGHKSFRVAEEPGIIKQARARGEMSQDNAYRDELERLQQKMEGGVDIKEVDTMLAQFPPEFIAQFNEIFSQMFSGNPNEGKPDAEDAREKGERHRQEFDQKSKGLLMAGVIASVLLGGPVTGTLGAGVGARLARWWKLEGGSVRAEMIKDQLQNNPLMRNQIMGSVSKTLTSITGVRFIAELVATIGIKSGRLMGKESGAVVQTMKHSSDLAAWLGEASNERSAIAEAAKELQGAAVEWRSVRSELEKKANKGRLQLEDCERLFTSLNDVINATRAGEMANTEFGRAYERYQKAALAYKELVYRHRNESKQAITEFTDSEGRHVRRAQMPDGKVAFREVIITKGHSGGSEQLGPVLYHLNGEEKFINPVTVQFDAETTDVLRVKSEEITKEAARKIVDTIYPYIAQRVSLYKRKGVGKITASIPGEHDKALVAYKKLEDFVSKEGVMNKLTAAHKSKLLRLQEVFSESMIRSIQSHKVESLNNEIVDGEGNQVTIHDACSGVVMDRNMNTDMSYVEAQDRLNIQKMLADVVRRGVSAGEVTLKLDEKQAEAVSRVLESHVGAKQGLIRSCQAFLNTFFGAGYVLLYPFNKVNEWRAEIKKSATIEAVHGDKSIYQQGAERCSARLETIKLVGSECGMTYDELRSYSKLSGKMIDHEGESQGRLSRFVSRFRKEEELFANLQEKYNGLEPYVKALNDRLVNLKDIIDGKMKTQSKMDIERAQTEYVLSKQKIQICQGWIDMIKLEEVVARSKKLRKTGTVGYDREQLKTMMSQEDLNLVKLQKLSEQCDRATIETRLKEFQKHEWQAAEWESGGVLSAMGSKMIEGCIDGFHRLTGFKLAGDVRRYSTALQKAMSMSAATGEIFQAVAITSATELELKQLSGGELSSLEQTRLIGNALDTYANHFKNVVQENGYLEGMLKLVAENAARRGQNALRLWDMLQRADGMLLNCFAAEKGKQQGSLGVALQNFKFQLDARQDLDENQKVKLFGDFLTFYQEQSKQNPKQALELTCQKFGVQLTTTATHEQSSGEQPPPLKNERPVPLGDKKFNEPVVEPIIQSEANPIERGQKGFDFLKADQERNKLLVDIGELKAKGNLSREDALKLNRLQEQFNALEKQIVDAHNLDAIESVQGSNRRTVEFNQESHRLWYAEQSQKQNAFLEQWSKSQTELESYCAKHNLTVPKLQLEPVPNLSSELIEKNPAECNRLMAEWEGRQQKLVQEYQSFFDNINTERQSALAHNQNIEASYDQQVLEKNSASTAIGLGRKLAEAQQLRSQTADATEQSRLDGEIKSLEGEYQQELAKAGGNKKNVEQDLANYQKYLSEKAVFDAAANPTTTVGSGELKPASLDPRVTLNQYSDEWYKEIAGDGKYLKKTEEFFAQNGHINEQMIYDRVMKNMTNSYWSYRGQVAPGKSLGDFLFKTNSDVPHPTEKRMLTIAERYGTRVSKQALEQSGLYGKTDKEAFARFAVLEDDKRDELIFAPGRQSDSQTILKISDIWKKQLFQVEDFDAQFYGEYWAKEKGLNSRIEGTLLRNFGLKPNGELDPSWGGANGKALCREMVLNVPLEERIRIINKVKIDAPKYLKLYYDLLEAEERRTGGNLIDTIGGERIPKSPEALSQARKIILEEFFREFMAANGYIPNPPDLVEPPIFEDPVKDVRDVPPEIPKLVEPEKCQLDENLQPEPELKKPRVMDPVEVPGSPVDHYSNRSEVVLRGIKIPDEYLEKIPGFDKMVIDTGLEKVDSITAIVNGEPKKIFENGVWTSVDGDPSGIYIQQGDTTYKCLSQTSTELDPQSGQEIKITKTQTMTKVGPGEYISKMMHEHRQYAGEGQEKTNDHSYTVFGKDGKTPSAVFKIEGAPSNQVDFARVLNQVPLNPDGSVSLTPDTFKNVGILTLNAMENGISTKQVSFVGSDGKGGFLDISAKGVGKNENGDFVIKGGFEARSSQIGIKTQEVVAFFNDGKYGISVKGKDGQQAINLTGMTSVQAERFMQRCIDAKLDHLNLANMIDLAGGDPKISVNVESVGSSISGPIGRILELMGKDIKTTETGGVANLDLRNVSDQYTALEAGTSDTGAIKAFVAVHGGEIKDSSGNVIYKVPMVDGIPMMNADHYKWLAEHGNELGQSWSMMSGREREDAQLALVGTVYEAMTGTSLREAANRIVDNALRLELQAQLNTMLAHVRGEPGKTYFTNIGDVVDKIGGAIRQRRGVGFGFISENDKGERSGVVINAERVTTRDSAFNPGSMDQHTTVTTERMQVVVAGMAEKNIVVNANGEPIIKLRGIGEFGIAKGFQSAVGVDQNGEPVGAFSVVGKGEAKGTYPIIGGRLDVEGRIIPGTEFVVSATPGMTNALDVLRGRGNIKDFTVVPNAELTSRIKLPAGVELNVGLETVSLTKGQVEGRLELVKGFQLGNTFEGQVMLGGRFNVDIKNLEDLEFMLGLRVQAALGRTDVNVSIGEISVKNGVRIISIRIEGIDITPWGALQDVGFKVIGEVCDSNSDRKELGRVGDLITAGESSFVNASYFKEHVVDVERGLNPLSKFNELAMQLEGANSEKRKDLLEEMNKLLSKMDRGVRENAIDWKQIRDKQIITDASNPFEKGVSSDGPGEYKPGEKRDVVVSINQNGQEILVKRDHGGSRPVLEVGPDGEKRVKVDENNKEMYVDEKGENHLRKLVNKNGKQEWKKLSGTEKVSLANGEVENVITAEQGRWRGKAAEKIVVYLSLQKAGNLDRVMMNALQEEIVADLVKHGDQIDPRKVLEMFGQSDKEKWSDRSVLDVLNDSNGKISREQLWTLRDMLQKQVNEGKATQEQVNQISDLIKTVKSGKRTVAIPSGFRSILNTVVLPPKENVEQV